MTDELMTPDQPDELEKSSRLVFVLVTTERVVASLALLVTLVLVLLQVTSRYVFQAPLSWTEETARFTLVWLAFVSAGFVMARRGHISVDLLVDKLGLKSKRVVNGFAISVVLITSVVMTWAGVQLALATVGLKSPAAGISTSLLYLAVAVGFLLIFVHGVLNTVFDLRRRGKPKLKSTDGEIGEAA
ncbi:TRAP transporter small permease [Cryobacterium psychrophilum]|uniref:TRAP transporter small permease n=1 Tax=Cryobacterium psychrophilum TaxID=41988 RepID=A0A4Y8KS52_9MICO|nr:TRAP transporter small permease [Cryobacterium psychrophilum]TDW29523.1 TRAP-type C4-dicarboxylate transport system permease small subunit [Cryobacterium psychrophilum]TFD81661.1 TRAP transporter small permease [Cryobacterium psychrophilum]